MPTGIGNPANSPEALREKLELLDGSRRKGSIYKAAVRIEDLQPLLELAPAMKATAPAGATPTAAEYEALRADVQEVFNRLRALADKLQKRVKP